MTDGSVAMSVKVRRCRILVCIHHKRRAKTALKAFLSGKHVFALLQTLVGKSLGEHQGSQRLATGRLSVTPRNQ